jgi:hypothetical protein
VDPVGDRCVLLGSPIFKSIASLRVIRHDEAMSLDIEPFCHEAPSPHTAVDLFAGQWSSQLPPPYEKLTGGTTPLFDDERITWGAAQLGGVKDSGVLELGPLEGGHTFMLDRLGAAHVTAIEGNTRAFLRCLVVKELLGMPSAHFLCGDFVPYLRDAIERQERWDLCLAVGVLYHQQDPVGLLELVTQVSDRLLLWTHYYDAELQGPDFAIPSEKTTAGFDHTLYRREYGQTVDWPEFCGGLNQWTSWMTRTSLLSALDHFGFVVEGVAFDDAHHPNGPAFCTASRRR